MTTAVTWSCILTAVTRLHVSVHYVLSVDRFFLVDAPCLNASNIWFMTDQDWKRKDWHKWHSFIPVCRCIRHDEANDWLGHRQPTSHSCQTLM